MIIRKKCTRLILVLLFLSPHLTGCAVVTPVLISGIGAGASYSIYKTAYKTESCPLEDVYWAAMKSLRGMKFDVVKVGKSETGRIFEVLGIGKSETGRIIEAATSERHIITELEKVTPDVTRVTVNVKKGPVIKDKATAEEIIRQLESELFEGKACRKTHSEAMLSVTVIPDDAVIRIMNIQQKFYQGIELAEGKYRIEVSAPEFNTKDFWIQLEKGEERLLEVTLDKQ